MATKINLTKEIEKYGGRNPENEEGFFYNLRERGKCLAIPIIGGLSLGGVFALADLGDARAQALEDFSNKSRPVASENVKVAQENGTCIYIGEIRLGSKLPDVEWPELHSMFYHELGPKLVKRKFEVGGRCDDYTEISGTITELTFTVRASLNFKDKKGKILGGGSYEVPRGDIEDVMNGLTNKIAIDLRKIKSNNYIIEEEKKPDITTVYMPFRNNPEWLRFGPGK